MRTTTAVTADVTRYVERGWHLDAADTEPARWPKRFPLGTVTSADADQRWAEVRAWSHHWHDWAEQRHVTLQTVGRRIRGTSQQLPTHLLIDDPDTAAMIAEAPWPITLSTGRQRAHVVHTAFPDAPAAEAVRLAASLSDIDFDLACTAATWFITHPNQWTAMTPRQVPVEGLHGKWLNNHRAIVETLARSPVTLAHRPTRVHWTYLDPHYRASGARIHDSLTLGDAVTLPYTPRTVIIAENKDSAVLFPPVADAVCAEGNGNAAPALLPMIPWMSRADRVIYWGDIDAAGLEILDRLRGRIPHVESILMDYETFEHYERFGTSVDERGRPMTVHDPRPCPNLTAAERALYDRLTDSQWTRHRRIEQERIPLAAATARVRCLIGR